MVKEEKKVFKILIVDDNLLNVQVLEKILTENGYNVTVATDGKMAIEILLKAANFDLILLDIEMPGITGYETCASIRAEKSLKEIPVIFLTSSTLPENIVKGFEVGAQDYVTKPFNFKELLARVQTQIQLQHQKTLLVGINKILEEKVLERTRELEKSNAQLAIANSELLKLDQVKSEFLTAISTETRAPINRIKGPIEILKSKINTKSLAELIDIIDESTSGFEKFLLQALEITRLRSGNLVRKNTRLQVGTLIEFALMESQKEIIKKKLDVRVTCVEEHVITGDFELLMKCLGNIVGNACKFSPDGGIVEISTEKQNDFFTIHVADYGAGMKQNTIFSLFNRDTPFEINENKKIGLGLIHSKLIAEEHGGKIQIESTENKGTTVKLIFPGISEN